MKNKYQSKSLIIATVVSLFTSSLFGQLTVDMAMTPDQMVQNLVGNGVQISNVVVTACDGSYGYYYANSTEIGTSQGLLLTTGKAEYAIGPNNKIGTCSSGGNPLFPPCSYFDNGCPGSPLLNQTHNRPTRDATMFEFDIIPKGDSLKFKYTFASEEYNEWVGSPFNDVFGFFISGPNIGTDVNLAVIPGTNEMVAINSVNANSNSQYWFDNQNPYGQHIQYDGFTINLEAAVGNLIPCETYHLKLIIADGQDRVYDSGVFISSIESNPVVVLTATSNGLDYMVEGCNDGTITFSRESASPEPLDVTYWVGGTATNGTDYLPLLGSGVPDEPITVTIPANEQSVSIELTAVNDGIDEGTEYITIFLVNPLCDNVEILDSVMFYIHDFLDVTIAPQDTTICLGNCVELVGSSSLGTLADYVWSSGVSDPNSLTVEVCPTEDSTYSLTATVGICEASAEATIQVTSLSITLGKEDIHCLNGATGSITATVTNGVEPYTYAWTGPNGFVSDEESPTGLVKGTYHVVVTDANDCSGEANITLIEEEVLSIQGTVLTPFGCGYAISCNGENDGGINMLVSGGVEPYSFVWTTQLNDTIAETQNITSLSAGTYTISVTDDVGCQIIRDFTLTQPNHLEIEVEGTVDLLCSGVETGEATVSTTGGCPTYTYSWTSDDFDVSGYNGPHATNLASGTYYVSVTDQNGCSNGGQVEIVINDPIDPVTAVLDGTSYYNGFGVSCPGAEDGFIMITPSGGTAPYSFEWKLGDTIFSTAEDLADAPCGTYSMRVMDGNDCGYSQQFTISCVPAISVNYTTVPNPCGAPEGGLGEIHITSAVGGHGAPFVFSWIDENGNTYSGTDLTGLNSGDYILTAEDTEGCQTQLTVHIGQNDEFVVTGDVTDASCYGENDGAIDVSMNPAGDYTYSWTGPNGFTSDQMDITDLAAGSYSLTISSATCEDIFSFTVGQPNQIDIELTVTDASCVGNNNGKIDAEITGGSGDYSYTWLENSSTVPPFVGSADEDISDLGGGTYTLEVIDNVTGCSANASAEVNAPVVMNITVETSLFAGGYNVSCFGASDGQLTVFVEGGTPYTIGDPALPSGGYIYDWTSSAECQGETVFLNPGDYGNDLGTNPNHVGNLPAGTYSVLAFDANGCQASTCYPISQPDELNSSADIENITCGNTNSGAITPNISGGLGASYTSYEWTQGDIGTNAPNAATLTGLAAGTYELVVSNLDNCSKTFTYIINVTPSPIATIVSQENILCNADGNGEFILEFSGGTAPYDVEINGDSYLVDNDGDQLALTNLSAGDYIINYTDQDGCMNSLTITITEPEELTMSLSAVIQEAGQIYPLQCFGDVNGAIAPSVAGGTASYSYSWTNEALDIISINDTLIGMGAGVYTLTVTDANSCSISESFELTQPDNEIVVTSDLLVHPPLNLYNVSCPGEQDGEIVVEAIGGVGEFYYDWAGNGVVDSMATQTGLAAGHYTLVVTDENFCQKTFEFDLIEPSPVVLDIQLSLYDGGYNISCTGADNGTIDINNITGGDAPYVVVWSTNDDPDFAYDPGNPNHLSDLKPGTYTVTVTDANECEVSQDVIISEPSELTALIEKSYNCVTSIAELCVSANGGSGGYTFQWDNGSTATCITVATSGPQSVTVIDSNGCEVVKDFVVAITTPVSISGTIENETCSQCNGTVQTEITASPGYSFEWNNGANTEDLSNLCPGTYTMTVTDINNCSYVHSFTIVASPEISVSVTSENVLCHGDSTGSVSISLTGGVTEPIVLLWEDSNGNIVSENNSVQGLPSGTYTVLWSEATGCTGDSTLTITEPTAMELNVETSVYFDINISTVGGNDGWIEVGATGGVPGYTYDWSHNVNAHKPRENGLFAGDYLITVTDANGCAMDTVVRLVDPEEVRLYNGLTPNGDGFNDTYVVPGVLYCSQAVLTVFNRWGNIVYEKANYKNDWYGQTTDGGVLPDGTYFVIFEGCGNKQLSTYVDLRRE